MNVMQMLGAQPWVEPLGRTLLHFLWQGLAIALLCEAVRQSLPRTSSPRARYWLACAALAAMITAPIVTWARALLLDALWGLMDQLPARSVRLVILSLEQQQEFYRDDEFTLATLPRSPKHWTKSPGVWITPFFRIPQARWT